MSKRSLLRLGVYLLGVILIIGVLSLSILRQHLYSPSSQDLQSQADASAMTRVQELRQWPPTPDHPLYPFRMLGDQARLLVSTTDERPLLKLELANDRLSSSKILLLRKRSSLALTTLTKSTKYVLSAASDAKVLSPQSSSQVRGEVRNSITIQIQELGRLKQSFSDEQKPIIDRLISELALLRETFL